MENIPIVGKSLFKLCGIPIEAMDPPVRQLPPEVRFQLIRIIQEALGNVRKHADATSVQLNWEKKEDCITLSIYDNGQGFDPEDVPPMARHGLRIMRERAELLDADFQIISQQDSGTQVLVRLPIEIINMDGKPHRLQPG